MKFLIVSWGDFERWKGTKYKFGDETSTCPSTLPILQKVIKPDWTVIVLSETLGEDFSSREALHDDIKNRVNGFLEQIGAGREVDVIIAPGIGHFSHGEFLGNAMDTYYYVLNQLSQVLPVREELEVHFDITHGLNYITFLTYRAIKDLLGTAAILNPVKFTAYNSDPYVQKISRELTINVIEDVKVEPHPVQEPLPGLERYLVPYLVEKRLLGELKASLSVFRLLREEKRRLEAWAGSVALGMPLLFVEDFPETEALERAVEELLHTWEDYITVSEKSVKRKLALGEGFGVLVKLLFQARVLKELKPNLPPSVDELYNISDKLFRGSVKEMTRVELGNIEETAIKYASANLFPDWMPLKDFMCFSSANPQIKPRNFLAHAGLEANATEVKMERWKYEGNKGEVRKHTFLRYAEAAKIEIERITANALRGG
ncbi:CRISPR-associated CARF protein Csx1 [Thermococcus sp.]